MGEVILVWGPPASGKTTYVKKNMAEGDLVVDLDAIKQAISFRDRDDFDDRLMPIVFDIRDLLYSLIQQGKPPCDVWVIAGVPKQADRRALINKLGITDVVFMDVSEDECLRRAYIDTDRKDKQLQEHIIARWFSRYRASEAVGNFYHTTAWRKKRKQILQRDNHECQMCKAEGGYSKGNVVHHIEYLEDRPDLALVDSNLITVCEACHNKLHPERWDVGRVAKREQITAERW